MKKFLSTYGLHILLAALAFGFALPFVWMVLTSLKPLKDVDSESWFPADGRLRWENYREVFDTAPSTDVTGTLLEVGCRMSDVGMKELIAGKESRPDVRHPISDTIQILPAHGGEPVDVTIDRKTRFTNPATGETIALDSITPGDTLRAIRPVGEGIPFVRFYWNSLFVASWITFLQVLTSALAAYAFARLQWKGRDQVFLLYLATMMLPGLVMMIPNYQIMIKLGLVDTYAGLIIPASFSAFGTFLLRQFMLTIPTSLDEAAEIDGASKWQIFWNVILPLSRPGLITLTIFTFIGSYNSFFWPLVMLKSTTKYTLPVGMLFFDSTRGQVTHLMMAAITMSVLPVVLVFILLQKQMVKGIQLGAVKG